jgi:hypothetical protein
MHNSSRIDRFEPALITNTSLRPFPLQVIIVLLILFFGMAFNMPNKLPVFVFLVIILTMAFYRKGLEVKLNSATYRDFHQFYFFKIGQWKSLGEYDLLLITRKAAPKQAMINIGYSVSYNQYCYELNLITKGSRDVFLKTTGEYDDLVDFAKSIGSYFTIRVSERVDGEYYWIYTPESFKE